MDNTEKSRDLFVYNGGFLTNGRVRRILELAGWNIRLGLPGPDDWVGVWGASPTSPRGLKVARDRDAPVLRVEDAFLRSRLPGRAGEPTRGLVLDERGVHFDASMPSDLEHLLETALLDDTVLLNRARASIDKMAYWQVSKFNDFERAGDLPPAPYVLVIDQTRGDASVVASGADRATFQDMLVQARSEHPGSRVLIKSHPETLGGHRLGHFDQDDCNADVSIYSGRVSPWLLMQGASAVYTVSSQFGFDAIFAGHKPRVFGQPFYAGWGLTSDEATFARRTRRLTRAQLFAGAMLLYPKWYDPAKDRLTDQDRVIDALAADKRAGDDDRYGYFAPDMRLWKRPHLRRYFGATGGIRFTNPGPKTSTHRVMRWGAGAKSENTIRIEDGFLRSRGLGANLIPPLSLVTDRVGMYYDPSTPSDLENLIAESPKLPEVERLRAQDLIAKIVSTNATKYNVGQNELPTFESAQKLLVVGQVEDDQSVQLGCDTVRTNFELLERTRELNPKATIIYKPHPDVEAGLRAGKIEGQARDRLCDFVAHDTPAHVAIDGVDEIWTMTSLMGFEGLLRGRKVVCLGMPFYAGWGLTRDLGISQLRRKARPDLIAMAHAVLIGYPRYFDPKSGATITPEQAVDLLMSDHANIPPVNKVIALMSELLPKRLRTTKR